MKSTTLLAFVLLLALSSQPLLGGADASPEQVVDTLGKKLRVGANYYINIPSVPYPKFRPGGGLGLASVGKPCPLDVVVFTFYGRSLSSKEIRDSKEALCCFCNLHLEDTNHLFRYAWLGCVVVLPMSGLV
ncbi:Miraculin protein [Spatholobus suberectus]|nr:Miraculin protein [Spatholobus suberectus]